MTSNSRWIYAVSFVLASTGFLLPFWPLSLAGVALCALSGRYIFALLIGLLLDVAYGAPLATARFLYFPFVAFALLCLVARVWGERYFFDRSGQEKI